MDFENFEEDIENEPFENKSFDEISEDENFNDDIENEELDCIDEEKNYTIMDDLKVKNKKMYFDEELVKDLIINHYQPFLDYSINEKGKKVCISRERVSKDVEKEIMANLLLIANAIINKYKYWRFEPLEDLRAESLKAMWQYLPNFVPGKGSAFDLFSIICKRHLLNYTLKNYKHRLTTDVEVCYDISSPDPTNYNLFFEDIEKTFLKIINEHYEGEKKKEYIELTSILMEYLDKNKKICGKNDLLSTFKEYGYKSTAYKKFIEEMSQYKDEFYELAK